MSDQDWEEWAGALSKRIEDIEAQVIALHMMTKRVTVGLAKMILGMSGQPVVIDIKADLGVDIKPETPLIVPGTTRQ